MIKVELSKCTMCEICKNKCPFGAIEIINNKVVVNENCKECSICVRNCPSQAIKKISNDNIISDTEFKNVYIYGESHNGKLKKVVYELLSQGRILSKKLNSKLGLVVIENINLSEKEKLKKYNIDKIHVLNEKEINYDNKKYSYYIKKFIDKYKPDIILFPATSIGREIAPYVASMCKTGVTADCTKLDIDLETKLLKQTRPTFGGKLFATITIPNTKPQICTVRSGVFLDEPLNKEKEYQYILDNFDINKLKENKKIINIENKKQEKINLEKAEIIVAGGLGLKDKTGFELLKKLANLLNGEIATTRACVEKGWIDSKYQIGQTGITVRPKIYIACGISGAIQHMSGIKNCNYIIAINEDRNAPIFEQADYGIVGDLYNILPKLIEKLEGKSE